MNISCRVSSPTALTAKNVERNLLNVSGPRPRLSEWFAMVALRSRKRVPRLSEKPKWIDVGYRNARSRGIRWQINEKAIEPPDPSLLLSSGERMTIRFTEPKWRLQWKQELVDRVVSSWRSLLKVTKKNWDWKERNSMAQRVRIQWTVD